jgi:predicted  nucleic acid-binding Zn-ribbon protein
MLLFLLVKIHVSITHSGRLMKDCQLSSISCGGRCATEMPSQDEDGPKLAEAIDDQQDPAEEAVQDQATGEGEDNAEGVDRGEVGSREHGRGMHDPLKTIC